MVRLGSGLGLGLEGVGPPLRQGGRVGRAFYLLRPLLHAVCPLQEPVRPALVRCRGRVRVKGEGEGEGRGESEAEGEG